jgi:hypothetical protein
VWLEGRWMVVGEELVCGGRVGVSGCQLGGWMAM